MQKFVYTIKDPLGLHARPAGLLAKEAAKFQAQTNISVQNKTADMKRIIALMTLGIKQGMEVTVTTQGTDEVEAIEALEKLLTTNL